MTVLLTAAAVTTGVVVAALLTAGVEVVGFAALEEACMVVESLFWFVLAAPLRALRAFDALLRVFGFGGLGMSAVSTGSTSAWAAVLPGSAAAFSSAAFMARVLRPV